MSERSSLAPVDLRKIAREEFPMLKLRGLPQCAFLMLFVVGFGGASSGHAQPFPSNTIRSVVPTGAGTPPDIISRVIAAERAETEGWRTLVENRPGALQTIGMSEVLKQPADGYSIYPMSVPTMVVPALLPPLGLRPDVDFTPVLKVSRSYNVLVVPPSVPAKSVAELVAILKKQPGRYNFSSAGFGRSEEHTSELQSQFHLVCRLLLEKKNDEHTIT